MACSFYVKTQLCTATKVWSKYASNNPANSDFLSEKWGEGCPGKWGVLLDLKGRKVESRKVKVESRKGDT